VSRLLNHCSKANRIDFVITGLSTTPASGPRSRMQGQRMDQRLSGTQCLLRVLTIGREVCAMGFRHWNSTKLQALAFLTNATSLYFVSAAFLPLLAKSVSSPTGKMGSIINTTSNSGLLRMFVLAGSYHSLGC
jgi:NAD(P)-dependent dehydrogenase (short-subunit alcohol dehydrogenase family)